MTACRYDRSPVCKRGEEMGLCDRHYRRFLRYGDPLGRAEAYQVTQDYKGRGRIRCAACGQPVRDHSLTEPCEMSVLR